VITVVDTTPPTVWCEEYVNPHGNNVPGEKRSKNAKDQAVNPDGFYRLMAEDLCTDASVENIDIQVVYVNKDGTLGRFGGLNVGDVVKITEAPGAKAKMQKIGSANGQAGAVMYHIIVPSDPQILAVDACGNMARFLCVVPPPPK
jgi:hypothetical protein